MWGAVKGQAKIWGAALLAMSLAPALADPGGPRLPHWARAGAPVHLRPSQRPAPVAAELPMITAALIKGSPGAVTLQLLLTGTDAEKLTPVISFRFRPHRLVLDVGNVALSSRVARAIDSAAGTLAIGLAGPGRVQAVLSIRGPFRVAAADVTSLAPGGMGPLRYATDERVRTASRTSPRHRRALITVTLVAADEASFAAAATSAFGSSASRVPVAAMAEAIGAAPTGDRKVVVIDAGHGGSDPGAVAGDGSLEKTIVLAVAKQVRQQLEATGRYRVVMTRERDIFVPLERRVDMSQAANADVFVSLHADSAGALLGTSPEAIRGASVYILSDRASSEDSRRLADKENAADLNAAGRPVEATDPASDIREILLDLTRAETQGRAADLRNTMVSELKRAIAVSREPSRSAAFRVLRQTRTPSVLIELGYMTNARDQAQMATADWQRKVAASIAGAIDRFLSRPSGPQP